MKCEYKTANGKCTDSRRMKLYGFSLPICTEETCERNQKMTKYSVEVGGNIEVDEKSFDDAKKIVEEMMEKSGGFAEPTGNIDCLVLYGRSTNVPRGYNPFMFSQTHQFVDSVNIYEDEDHPKIQKIEINGIPAIRCGDWVVYLVDIPQQREEALRFPGRYCL